MQVRQQHSRGLKLFKSFFAFIKERNVELLLFLICAMALVYRFYVNTYHLVMTPDYDGYQYVKIAKYLTKGEVINETVNWTPLFPVFIALFSFLPFPLDEIGSFVNIILGTVTIIPIYFLVKNLINKEAALFATLIYAFHYSIAFVNVQVMSETSYIFMFFLFAFLISEIIKGNYVFKYTVASGINGGLVYLGRPEGVLIFVALSIFVLCFAKKKFVIKVKWFFLNALFFFLTILPYLMFLRSKIGHFVFSGKSLEILGHIKNMMGVPDTGQGYFGTFTYDLSKTISFIGNNILNAWFITIDNNVFYGLLLVILVVCFVFAIRKSALGLLQGILFFISLILPLAAPLIFKVDHRYLSPTTSVLSVVCGIGLYQLYTLISQNLKTLFYKKLIVLIAFIFICVWGFYKTYDVFEVKGELVQMFMQERLYKRTGMWLKKNVPQDAVILSGSTNYLVTYYADLAYVNVSKDLTEEEVVELVCGAPHRYLLVNEYTARVYHKRLRFLVNPYSQNFKTSLLFDKIKNIYFDDIALVAIYTCKGEK